MRRRIARPWMAVPATLSGPISSPRSPPPPLRHNSPLATSSALFPSRPHHLFSSHAAFSQRHEEPPPLRDEDISRLSKEHQHQLRLADLVRYGRPPLSEEALLQSASFALELIPVRLARRLQALRNLPYIVVSNKHVRQIYGNYRHSLQSLLPWSSRRRRKDGDHHHHHHRTGSSGITTLDDEIAFTDVLAELVATHHNTIPVLAQGFLECRKYIAPADVTAFLDEHLRARIGTRMIAEQHLALHQSSRPFAGGGGGSGGGSPPSQGDRNSDSSFSSFSSPSYAPSSPSYIGIIDTQLRPARTVDSCAEFVADICELKYGVRPRWRIDGGPDAASGTADPGSCTFAYVPMHLEYIVTELLKNAFRAVVENGMHREPVVITIAPEPPHHKHHHQRQDNTDKDAPLPQPPILPLDDNAPGVTIRIRDRGGGISPDVLPNIWSYSFTTFTPYAEGTEASADASPLVPSPSSSSMLHPPPDDSLNILSSSGNGGGSSIAGLGYGLPLSRAYAEFFGGGITVQSLHGWGTDVYLRLKGVGTIE